MKDQTRWFFVAVVLGAVAAALFFWQQRAQQAPPPPPAPAAAAPETTSTAEPRIQFPVEPAADMPPLPALEQSDTSLRAELATLLGRKAFNDLFVPQTIIRRIVASVDNLPRETAARRLMPVASVGAPMLLTGDGEVREISAKNAARYLPYVVMAESVDLGKLVAIYVRHYPLFQQAYRELGFPTGYFNDRLVQVIDHLLETPEISSPIKVVQRKVMYEFVDPELQARSAGQKIMIRIGAENTARLKTRLKDLRRELTDQTRKP